MAINATDSERRAQAKREHTEKLRLEAKMAPDVKRLLRQMADDIETMIVVTGNVPQATDYNKTLEGIILGGYKSAQKSFAPVLFNQLDEEDEDSDIWAALLAIGSTQGLEGKDQILSFMRSDANIRGNEFVRMGSEQDTAFITRTNQEHFTESLLLASVVLTEALGRQPTKIELGEEARKQFLKSDLGRTTTITATTIQNAAEGTKQISLATLTSYRNGIGPVALGLGTASIKEYWDAILDSVTRAAHFDADGQQKENGVYIVKGEQLRYPGDRMLGASLGNVINCRCSSIPSYSEL